MGRKLLVNVPLIWTVTETLPPSAIAISQQKWPAIRSLPDPTDCAEGRPEQTLPGETFTRTSRNPTALLLGFSGPRHPTAVRRYHGPRWEVGS